ncbi:MAG: hypothetical protein CSA21_05300 [Deltaproteobacteria bacterium]|nr:MAG: hypothetical protein CSA21_05300 [Deltaproteobacteria bacterium]
MGQQYLSGNESDELLKIQGKPLPFFLCFSLLAVVNEELGEFCLSIPCANLLARSIPQKNLMPPRKL